MLKTNMEFKKGILFIRIKGNLNKDTVKEVDFDDFKYIVVNIDNLYSIDSYSIKYIEKIYKDFLYRKNILVICDKFNIAKKLFKDIPLISNEYDAYDLFERMI